MKLVDIAEATFKASTNKVDGLAKVMSLYTDRMMQEIVKNRFTEDRDVYNTFDKYLTSYKAFADKVKIQPDGLYTALKQLNPLLIESYDRYKETLTSKPN